MTSDLEHIQRVLEERAERLARPLAVTHQQEGIEIVLIGVGSESIGIPVAGLRELVPLPAVLQLPGLSPWIAGIVQIRGELFTVIDIARWWQIDGGGTPRFLAIVEQGDRALGLACERVMGYRRTPAGQITAELATAGRPIAGLTQDLVSVLDLGLVFGREDILAR